MIKRYFKTVILYGNIITEMFVLCDDWVPRGSSSIHAGSQSKGCRRSEFQTPPSVPGWMLVKPAFSILLPSVQRPLIIVASVTSHTIMPMQRW